MRRTGLLAATGCLAVGLLVSVPVVGLPGGGPSGHPAHGAQHPARTAAGAGGAVDASLPGDDGLPTGRSGAGTADGQPRTPATDPPAATPAAAARRVAVVERTADGRPGVRTLTAATPAQATALARDLSARPGVTAAVDGTASVLDAAPDPLRPQQWALSRLSAEAVWDRTQGDGETVAVLDTGVDVTHPDLAGRLLPGIDLVAGGSGPVTGDPHGHGTHVAGIVAADRENGIGTAGLAPRARVLPVRVLDASGIGYLSTVAAGVLWATDQGADVINLSLGSDTDSPVLARAVEYARSRGAVVVAAAGNSRGAGNPVIYPAAYPGVIGVAAVDDADRDAGFSETGPYVALAAPGVGVLSTYRNGTYATMSGTSMAAPYVAAAAALLLADRPGLTPAQVALALGSTATDRGAPGRDDVYGAGVLDVRAAMAADVGPVAALGLAGGGRMTGLAVALSDGGAPLAGRDVTVLRQVAGAWEPVGAVRTDAAGQGTLWLRESREGEVLYRAEFDGTAGAPVPVDAGALSRRPVPRGG